MGVSSASRDIDFDARNEDIQGNIDFAKYGVIIWLLILSQFKYFYRTQQSRKQEAKWQKQVVYCILEAHAVPEH